jgi:hypothetical protein
VRSLGIDINAGRMQSKGVVSPSLKTGKQRTQEAEEMITAGVFNLCLTGSA